jgi:DNA repair protein RecN (Recombination protein N)
MLTELHIRNFALIERLDLSFGKTLNILTGETGAGKSIVIDALGLTLGERASSDFIRTGTDKATVEAVFDLRDASEATKSRLADGGLGNEDDPEMLILAREVTRSGKTQCRVNGHLVPVALLREVGQELVDVHGQHEHQSLLSVDAHIDLLDNWLGVDVQMLRASVGKHYAETNRLRRELEDLRSQARERARNLDLYRFQQEEIAAAALRPGEEEELASERSRLANAEKLHMSADEAYESLANTALDGLNTTLAGLERASAMDETLTPIIEQLTESVAFADEARRLLRSYRDGIEFNPERLEAIEERVTLLRSLQRKYGDTLEEIIAYGEELTAKLDVLENSEAREADLEKLLKSSEETLGKSAAKLTKMRREGSKKFAAGILAELKDLGMAATRFEVSIEAQAIGAKGADKVEFLLSPNPGEPLKPLVKIASGGEASRLMLAIKSVLARAAFVPTLIFDEIDVGVGGRTARTIADKLSALSSFAQILCITHLPQIASRPASAHFFIEKRVVDGKTIVDVRPLPDEGRVEEIARMLGGDESETVRQHAREMLATH